MSNVDADQILYRVIDICTWCKSVSFSCEECNDLYGACRRNMAILDLRKYFKTDSEVAE